MASFHAPLRPLLILFVLAFCASPAAGAHDELAQGQYFKYKVRTPSTELFLTYEVLEKFEGNFIVRGTAVFENDAESTITRSRVKMIEETFFVEGQTLAPFPETYTSAFWNMEMWHPYDLASFEVSPDLRMVVGGPCEEIDYLELSEENSILGRDAKVLHIYLKSGYSDVVWIADDIPLVAMYEAYDAEGKMRVESVLIEYREPETPPAIHFEVGGKEFLLTSTILSVFNRF